MPTTRRRHQVTETPEVERALDAAARMWPDLSRSQLAVRLITENGERIDRLHEARADQRRAAVERIAGSFPGLFPTGIRDELRNEWPE